MVIDYTLDTYIDPFAEDTFQTVNEVSTSHIIINYIIKNLPGYTFKEITHE